jgi:hypothetical protein
MGKANLATFPEGSILVADYIDATRQLRCGTEESPLEDCLHCETLDDGGIQVDKGKLFKHLLKEYGRCTGKVYINGPHGAATPIGWVFQKRVQYDDCKETYLQEVWASFATVTPRKARHLSIA